MALRMPDIIAIFWIKSTLQWRLIANEIVVIQNIILNVAPGFTCKNYYGDITFFTLKLHIGFNLLHTRGRERGLTMLTEY